MQIDVIIATRGDIDKVRHTLTCLDKQKKTVNFKICNIFLLIDNKLDNTSTYNDIVSKCVNILGITYIYSNCNCDFIPNTNNISYIRNYGISKAKSEYIMCLDDDVGFDEDFLTQMSNSYIHLSSQNKKNIILVPTILYRDTNQIQTMGINKVYYRMLWPKGVYNHNDLKWKIWNKLFGKTNNDSYKQIITAPSICILGPREVLVNHKYDERMKFVYEDIDLLLRISRYSSTDIYTDSNIFLRHYEADKNILQQSFINPERIYQKCRNRIIFVHNTAYIEEKILFYMIGFVGQLIRRLIYILIYSDRRLYSISQMIYGTIDGLKLVWGKNKKLTT